jgi:alpha-beta hydrolase superfamily lysophospholipase
MKETTLGYLSHDGTSQIRALLWEDTTSPLAVIQIIHGAAEHIERYRDFAAFLVNEGYVVCGADHIGHGKSVSEAKQLGHMPLKGGRDILVEDAHSLRKQVQEKYPNAPYLMLGHSMGSFILREYLTQYGEGLAAAIISGTGQQNPTLSAVGSFVAKATATLRGAENRSNLLHNLGLGAYGKQVPNARTELDWLSTDPATVDAYIADDESGMRFSAGAYATLTDLTGRMVTPTAAAKIPKTLPLLFIAGAEDPVGENGEGVRRAVAQYQQAGVEQITLKLYEGMRHEVLNEVDRKVVYKDIADWIRSVSRGEQL